MVYILFLVFALLFRPGSALQRMKAGDDTVKNKIITALFIAVTVFVLVFPMHLPRAWNGEVPMHRNQYERMAESLLQGHLYIFDDADPKLAEMENPYDPAARKAIGVKVHWDSAYFEGKYYFYFGIVPVLILFLPFRAIAGISLPTYIGTAIFTAGVVIGIFLLFRLLSRRFFPKMTLGIELTLASAFSLMSLWYVSQAPALYCTAIVSALAMMVWSFYFFFRSVYVAEKESRQVLFAVLGGSFGALAFGCRPPVAIANFIAVPMLITYLRQRKLSFKVVRHAIYAILPYVIVAALLMIYNYLRFHDPLEFGQAYQMTVADQHAYGSFLERFSFAAEFKGLVNQFFAIPKYVKEFPWVRYGGAIINFPVLIFSLMLFLPRTIRSAMKAKWFGVTAVLFALPILITLLDVYWSPYLLERYRLDIYWLMGIAVFIAFAYLYEHSRTGRQEAALQIAFAFLSFATIVLSVLFYLVPQDASFTSESPETLDFVRTAMFFIP
ncbi:MAG: hypothetical protein IK088_01925 [Lachnospiraceae bacterium]|nr:hypothetical protein [Lachnospiraceae bacterium]